MSDEQSTPNEQTDTAPDSNAGNAATFTQEQVNAIVGERARRASESAVSELLKSLGFEKPDELKAIVDETRQRKEAEMSEAEKARAEVEAARKQAEELKAALDGERQQRITDRRDNALAQALAAAHAIDADDALIWLRNKAAEDVAAIVREDGTVDPDGIAALVAKVRAEKPHFFRPGGPGSPSNRGGEVPQVAVNDKAAYAAQLAQQYGFKVDPRRLSSLYEEQQDRDGA